MASLYYPDQNTTTDRHHYYHISHSCQWRTQDKLRLPIVVVVVAGGGLVPGRLSFFIAALATLAVLIEAAYTEVLNAGVIDYSDEGILGATFFATAILTQVLSKKIKESE